MCSVRVCVRAGGEAGPRESWQQAGRGNGAAKRRSAAARVTAPAIPDARHTAPQPLSGCVSPCESPRDPAATGGSVSMTEPVVVWAAGGQSLCGGVCGCG